MLWPARADGLERSRTSVVCNSQVIKNFWLDTGFLEADNGKDSPLKVEIRFDLFSSTDPLSPGQSTRTGITHVLRLINGVPSC